MTEVGPFRKTHIQQPEAAGTRIDRAHCQLDVAGRVTVWPPDAEFISGTSRIDAQGQELAEFLGDSSASTLRLYLGRSSAHEPLLTFPALWGDRWLDVSVAAFCSSDGTIHGYVVWMQTRVDGQTPVNMERDHDDHRSDRVDALPVSLDSIAASDRYQVLWNFAADAIFLHAANGEILDVNRQACVSLGYARDELIGQMPMLYSARLTERRLDDLQQGLSEGRTVCYETVHRRKSGEEFPVEVKVTRVDYLGEQFTVSSVRDRTEMHQERRALLESEEQLRLALETIKLGTWRYRLGDECAELDRRCQEVMGFEQPSVPTHLLIDRIHPEDRNAVSRAMASAYEQQVFSASVGIEHRLLMPDSSVRWVSVRALPQGEIDGTSRRPTRLIGTLLDITKPKFAALSLRGQNEIFEAIAVGQPLGHVLERIVTLIEAQIPGSICSILLSTSDEQHLVFASGPRLPEGLREICGFLPIGPMVGACGSAAFHRHSIVIRDTLEDERFAGYRNVGNDFGLRSCWSVPIFGSSSEAESSKQPLLGTFAVYRGTPGIPDRHAQLSLATGSRLASVAISNHRAIQDSREAEERYSMISQITRSVTFGITVSASGQWHFDWSRPSFGLLSGYSREEVNEIGWRSLVHPADQSQIDVLVRQVLAGHVGRSEFRYRTKDNQILHVQAHAKLLRRDLKTGAAVIIGGLLDMSEQKAIEQALRRSESFLRKAQRLARLGRWEFDLVQRTFLLCEQTVRHFSLSSPQLALGDLRRMIHPADRRIAREKLVRFRPSDRLELEFRVQIDDSVRWLAVKTAGGIEGENQSHRIWGILQDISDRKQLEDQFRQAQRLEAFGQLAGGVAHDFNNLLTVINGTADMALEGLCPDDAVYSGIMEIRNAGERAATLTRQLLVLSRQQFSEPSIIDVNQAVSRTESMLRRIIGEHIQLETYLQDPLPPIRIGQGQLDQVLLNLAVNARDAMEVGGVLRIETRLMKPHELPLGLKDECSSPCLRVTVSDTGCGMTDEVKARMFEPFFSTKGVGKGTGLGLATVYGIVQQSHGAIEVESHVGCGTTFDLYFPAVVTDMKPTAGVIHEKPTQRGHETILLVEDEELVRQLTMRVLSNYGYEVLEANSGENAILVATSHPKPIHLLLTDVVMPGISGTDLAVQLRRLFPELHVLYMSGYADDDVLRRGVFTQQDSFLQKPFTPASLVRRVQEVLQTCELTKASESV